MAKKKKSLTSFHIGFDRCLSSIDEQIQSNSNLSNHLCIAYLYDMRLFLTLSLFTLSQVAAAPTASRTMQASAQTKWVKCKQPKKKIWLEWMHEKKEAFGIENYVGLERRLKWHLSAFQRYSLLIPVKQHAVTHSTVCPHRYDKWMSCALEEAYIVLIISSAIKLFSARETISNWIWSKCEVAHRQCEEFNATWKVVHSEENRTISSTHLIK